MKPSSTMHALIVEDCQTGIFRTTEIPRPEPIANQVLVRIKASGVNPLDSKIRTGKAPHAKPVFPAVLGTDLAGIVAAVGHNVTAFSVGDEVYGMTGGVGGLQGSLAEFAAVDADLLAKKPTNLTFREAAALPLVFLTAWEGLVDQANVHDGQKVLILGGSGGVGHVAVQIARARGAKVFATASAAKHDMVQQLGAVPIDYRSMAIAQIVQTFTDGQGFDVVYDSVGGSTLDDAFEAVRNYGHVVSNYGWGSHSLLPLSRKAATYSGVFVLLPLLTGEGRAHHGEILRQATQLAEANQLRPVVDPRQFTLETALSAHEAVDQGTAVTKIVIDL
ncbi:zinc-dependent alcohol dehydrogenase family protein [Tumidithrix elongata RA019]|uniref:Zinc-dependent alcohol dehydrogenase family protein n=1 Tax=Tumidithrix elongata BACA0141 TaxID=2716417 RepID=A0AAW9Q5N4_9CYAN|nr:zinc-dependent alcohol dehydrogenase family protein [Tumidithrix elongata RA019]